MRTSLLAAAVLLAATAARAAAPATVTFAVDARVELLSVVLMLSDPADFKSRRPEGLDAYASAAAAAFARFSGHPAVARVTALRNSGVPASALVRAVLAPAGDDALRGDLSDFEKAARFGVFFEARRKEHQAFIETARRESLHALSPESALAYMGLPFSGEHRFILAPLLPDDAGAAELRVRPGAPARGAIRFRFDTFEGSVAAELCRSAASWIQAPAGDIPAQIAAAVGLRVIAGDLGERVYLSSLRRLAAPRLAALSERLKDYEGDRARYPTLESFSLRLEALAEIRLEQASRAASGGDRAAALALLAAARAQSPDLETRRRMVFLYQDLKEGSQAKGLSDELLQASPGDPGLQLDRAEISAKAGDRATALGFLAEAGKLRPDEAARRRMAELYLELREHGPARDLLDRLMTDAPQDCRLRLDRALVAVRTGERATALRLLAEAAALGPAPNEIHRMAFLHHDLKDHGPAQALLDRLIAQSPEDALLRVDRAAVAATAGDREAALRSLSEARKLSPSLEARHRIALLYWDLKDEQHGRDLMDELLQSSPQDARVLMDRAALAARAGERDAALKHLAAALLLNPSFDERRLIASQHQELGALEQARGLTAGLISAAPRDPRLRIDLAALAAKSGDRAAALRALGEARDLKPDADGRRRMAMIHQDLKDYAAALGLLAPLAREQPENASLRGDLGLCEYLAGQTDAAITDLLAALKLSPASLPAVITLGSIYAAQKRFKDELAVYDAAPLEGGEPELRAMLKASRQEALARARHE
jgi:tetratricopeptide (TPR) repeat protein